MNNGVAAIDLNFPFCFSVFSWRRTFLNFKSFWFSVRI